MPPGIGEDRAGKDETALHWTAVASAQRIGTYWHLLPESAQARKAIWDAVNPHSAKRRIDEAFPKALRDTTREVDMMIRFKNGSTWQVVGSDNYDSLVGSPPIGVVFSEWSLAKPEAWSYLRPILAENKGWALFIWTPRGRNHATRGFEAHEHDPDWFCQKLPATETDVFTPEDLARERKAYIDETGSEEEGDAIFRQEYMVDFNVAVPGSYFGPLLAKAQDEGRIGEVAWDQSRPVDTAWDLGVDDHTAIWFLQNDGKAVRVIDYYETSGEGADAIVLTAIKPKAYRYGTHFLPHDVMVREWGAGAKTRLETLQSLGVTNINIGQQRDPAERINATRQLLPVVSFDSTRCSAGIDRLRNYRRRWNKALSTYTGPLHDESSHAADAFGEYAVNCAIRLAPEKPKATEPKDSYRRQAPRNWKVA